eukprot:1780293-Amphidinium_carterae.1
MIKHGGSTWWLSAWQAGQGQLTRAIPWATTSVRSAVFQSYYTIDANMSTMTLLHSNTTDVLRQQVAELKKLLTSELSAFIFVAANLSSSAGQILALSSCKATEGPP